MGTSASRARVVLMVMILNKCSLSILVYNLYVLDTVRVFLPKCPLTTVRSRFSADELQLVRGEADDTVVVRTHLIGF